MSYNDPNWQSTVAYQYRVVAQNTVGYGGGVPHDDRAVDLERRSRSDCGTDGLTATPLAGTVNLGLD